MVNRKNKTKIAGEISLVMTTLPNKEAARVFSERLLLARRAACVSTSEPVVSRYWWKGKLTTEREVMLFIKTAACGVEALKELVALYHPYETPEILVIQISQVNAAYAAWVAQESAGHTPEKKGKKARRAQRLNKGRATTKKKKR